MAVNYKTKGTEYEKLVRELFESLHRADGVETIDVQHDHLVTGRSGCKHQIDVFWSFKAAGQTYKVAVECKAYEEKPVSIGRLRDFYGVLSDVPNLQGIFVSLDGFQSGSKRYAQFYGIRLYEARPPREEDWTGRVRDIHLTLSIVVPTIIDFRPVLSPTAAKPPAGLVFTLDCLSSDPIVFDEAGTPRASYDDIRGELPMQTVSAKGLKHRVELPGCIIRDKNGLAIPIVAIDLTYDVQVDSETTITEGEKVAKAIMRDVASGEITFFDRDGNARPVRS